MSILKYFSWLCLFVGLLMLGGSIFVKIVSGRMQDNLPPLKTLRKITFRVDPSFSQDERTKIVNAMKAWEEATDGLVEFSAYVSKPSLREAIKGRDFYDPMIYDARSIWGWIYHIARKRAGCSDASGLMFLPSGDIFIIDSKGSDFESIVKHELGHVLMGIWHSPNRDSIMYPYTFTDGSQKITTACSLLAKRNILASPEE